MSTAIGRYCELNGLEEIQHLTPGLDYRLPEYRREVFLRFYQFHTKHRSHPGAVYFALPYLFEKYNLGTEEKLWLCYINGLSQNILTTWDIFIQFPNVHELNWEAFQDFFNANFKKFGWDMDRRYVKAKFLKAVENYRGLIKGKTQEEYFNQFITAESPYASFDKLWDNVINNFAFYGRLSTFSYLEYLQIAGLKIDCSNLFIYDLEGSKSHRNGLCKVLGRDDMDWHDSNPDFVPYTREQLEWLEAEGAKLLNEAKARFPGASYFTLESTLCCFKSWFRKNRRYPNVYMDMFYERILTNEKNWGRPNNLFREMRAACLPEELRMEAVPNDPGVKPLKQNHFRETGEVILLDTEWECFANNYKTKIEPYDLFNNR